jgi:hypothetical protein
MKKVLELGDHYVSDFVKEQSAERKKYSLDLYLDEDLGAPRLLEQPPHDSMWGQYWYRSGINVSMTRELQGIVAEVQSRMRLRPGAIWLDIACNDGTLLKNVPDSMVKVGIDPADDSYVAESSKHAKIVQDYFSTDAWKRSGYGAERAQVITCIAMFYDLSNPVPFVQDLFEVLEDDGVLVLQMSYTPLMIQQMAFDNICHEHVYYYDLTSIKRLFERQGFRVVDCSLNDTNGGSFRIYLQKHTARASSFASAPLRDVCSMRVQQILDWEQTHGITNAATWHRFSDNLEKLKQDVVGFVRQARYEGKTVYGYGASTKGNTLLQLFGLTNQDITAIAERSPYKFGLRTVGTDIPIISEAEMRAAKPDYLLVLPWHFIDEFESREAEFLDGGGAFIVPCPEFKIIKR